MRPAFALALVSCTVTSGAELRRPASDGVVEALEKGVPKSIEPRLCGQMLAGVTRPRGEGAAIGVGSRLLGTRGSRLIGGFGHTFRRHAVEALLGVTIGLDCGDIAGKPPHDEGTGLT